MVPTASLFDGKVIGILPVCLWFVCDLSNAPFLGLLLLLLIGCVHVGLVLLEDLDELGMDSNCSRDTTHGILCECPSLVSTGDRGVHCHLTGAVNMGEKFFGGCSLHSKGGHEGDTWWEAFWNGHDDECCWGGGYN